MTEEGGNMLESRYRKLVSRPAFMAELKQYNLYYAEVKSNQQLQIHEWKGMPVLYGVLKLYWGTQRVIRLKKEELSWKRKSTRMAYENGLDEKLMNAMGSGARTRRSLTKLRDSFSEISEEAEQPSEQDQQEGSNNVFHQDDKLGAMRLGASLPRDGMKLNHDIITEVEGANGQVNNDGAMSGLSSTMPKKGSIPRRTMSFSGHLYNGKTRVFRPRYGTVSNIRVASTQSAEEVITLLLKKFAVENPPHEFSLFSVSNSGGTQELKINDFPLLKRIQLGPDENIAKIFVMDRKTSQISQEVAQYVNLSFTVLQGILKKYEEEESNEVQKIRKRYSAYQATLEKKIEAITDSTWL